MKNLLNRCKKLVSRDLRNLVTYSSSNEIKQLSFLGIGAQKAGTTWLYDKLAHHPDIFMPGVKEIHFWDMHYDKGIDWYKNFFSGISRDKITGEITPAYAIIGKDKIAECHKYFPNIKLIYIMRNPIERAWSSAIMALKRAEMTLDEASDQWFIDHFNSQGSLKRGDYKTCIEDWLNYYTEKQLLILDFNDIKHNPLQLLKKVCDHIGADAKFFEKSFSDNDQEPVNKGITSDIRKSLLPVLHDLYDEKIDYINKNYFKID